jgi:hypothetical protein
MADGKDRPISISFRVETEDSFEIKCSQGLNIRDKITGETKNTLADQTFRIHRNKSQCELLTRLLLSKTDSASEKDVSLLDAMKTNSGDYIMDVWPFPYQLSPNEQAESREPTQVSDILSSVLNSPLK